MIEPPTWLGKKNDLLLNATVSTFARIAAAVSTVIASLILSRKLGATESGYYFLAFSLISFLAAISRVGLDNTVLRYTGSAFAEQAWGTINSIFDRSILLVILVSFLIALVLYFSAGFLAQKVFGKPNLEFVLRAMTPGLVGVALFTLVSMGWQGVRRVISSATTISISVNSMLIMALLFFGVTNAEYAGWAFSGAALTTGMIACFAFKMSIGDGVGLISWRDLFKSCLPLWIVVIMSQLVYWSGQLIAGIWCEPEAIAQLAVAQRIALLTSFILTAFNWVVAPRFAALYKQGKLLEIEKLALSSARVLALLTLPIVTFILVAPAFLMSTFGDSFRDGAHLLKILAVGQFVNVITGSVAYLLTMSGHERELRNVVLISGPLAVILAIVMVPIWGVTGSAVATAIALAIQNLLAALLVARRLGFNTLAIWRR